MKRFEERHATQALDFGPLFGGSDRTTRPADPPAVDTEERLTWARRALLMSNLETFTAEDVRQFVVDMRPDLLGSGNWVGFTFRCSWFTMANPEKAHRELARGRWIWRYRLTPEGLAERNRITG